MEWAKHVVEAIVPSLVVHQGYDAKGTKDLPLAKTFGIWLPEDDNLSISDTLTLVSPVVMQKSVVQIWKQSNSAKWNEGVLHLVSVQEPSLTTLKELNYNPYAGYRRVQFQKKCQAVSDSGGRHRVRQKVMRTCEAIMDTAEPGTSADTEKPTTSCS